MTFDEPFSAHNLTESERSALAWHLAQYRARKTIEALLPVPATVKPEDGAKDA